MKEPTPPGWAERFLKWYCNPRYLEEIQGDIYELFDKRLEQGPRIARMRFVWDVMRFFRWANIKRSNSKYSKMNQLGLFKNYLKLGFRNMQRNLVSSSINIFGLAIAVGMAITSFVIVDMQLNMNRFHSKSDRIYQVINHMDQHGGNGQWSDTPMLLGPKLGQEHSAVEHFARLEYQSATVKHKNENFSELVAFTDPAYLEMFDFPITLGNNKVLYNKEDIVISHELAMKYFTNEDPIGQELMFTFGNGIVKRFKVGGVLSKFLYIDNLRHHIYAPFDNFFDLNIEESNSWAYLTDATFIQLKEGENVEILSDLFSESRALQHGSNSDVSVKEFEAIVLDELALRSYDIVGAIGVDNHPAGRISLIFMSCLLLSMACFNFMNISIAGATKRLKEIGMRKVMGGARREIISQFLVENTLQCLFALMVGALLAYFFLIPGFDVLTPHIDIQFRTFSPWTMTMFFVLLLLFVGLLSGTYPAFYISRFDAISIFKGNQKFGTSNKLSRVLLGLQLFLAFQTIVGCYIGADQFIHFSNKDWGYDADNVLFYTLNQKEQYEQLKDHATNNANIEFIGGSTDHIGYSMPRSSIVEYYDKKIPVRYMGATEDYFNVMGIRLKEGRFLTDNSQDQNNSVVVNQKFVDQMGWDDAINQTFTYDSIRRTVVGIAENFHYYNFFSRLDPVVIYAVPDDEIQYLSIKTASNKIYEVDSYMKEGWLSIIPNDPYNRFFQDDTFENFYSDTSANTTIIIFILIVSVVLACLGLYGLLAFNIQRKLKEFGVRKVLGAGPKPLLLIAVKEYIWVVIISFVLGAPIGIYLIHSVIASLFPDPKAISWITSASALILILLTLSVTVIGQVRKAITVNPANILRNE